MKEKSIYIKTLQLLILIPLYYIVGNKSIFLYVLSLSLYNIFLSCFSHISIKETITKLQTKYDKQKLLNITFLAIGVISAFFLLLSIFASEIMSSVLKINNLFLVFLLMGISIITEPMLNILTDYLEANKKQKKSEVLFNLYYISESILLLLVAIFSFRIFPLKNHIASSLLYLPKIISIILIFLITILTNKEKNIPSKKVNPQYNYRLDLKKILTKNHYKSIINIVKNSYYYISIIILYLVLTTRYNYAVNEIYEDITFIYFYAISLINYLIYTISVLIKNISKSKEIYNQMYFTFKAMLPVTIITGIISPLICKIIFYDDTKSIYLLMTIIMSIFIPIFNITIENITNKKILYTSLITGIILKLILTIPLINSFYRMGYNLIYGDVISTIISLLVTIIINYIYLKNKIPSEEKYLDKILKALYENILLCIILIILQFIVPISTNNYLKSLGLIILYLSISIMFINIKNKKRG